jgi:hypothetical protein
MDTKSVPQDNSSTYAKMKKAIYAKAENGKVQSVSSSGWVVEETVTRQALDDIEEKIKEAYLKVKEGKYSPLYYYMYNKRMDLSILSQATGFFRWSIKRDFNPKRFMKIKTTRLLVYCDVLGIEEDDIKRLPYAQV